MRHFWGKLALLAVPWGLLVWFVPLSAWAQCPGQTSGLVFLADEFKTVSTTATGLTQAVFQSGGYTASYAIVSVQQAAIVYRNVSNPTPTVGDAIPAGAKFPICGLDSIKTFKAIRQGDTDSVLFVNYYRSK